MKIKIKSFKEMKECGELETNSPEEQEYTRLKRQQLTGESATSEEFNFEKSEGTTDVYSTPSGSHVARIDFDGKLEIFDKSGQVVYQYKFDSKKEAEESLKDKFIKKSESKQSKKESGMTINDYRVGEIVEWDGDEWTIEEIDYENEQVSLENFDGDNRVWVDVDELDTLEESKKKSKKESFIRGYRNYNGDYAQLDCNEDGTDCDVSFFTSDNSEEPNAVIKDRHFDTLADAEAYLKDEGYLRESVKKEASNGYDILRDVEKDYYYIEGPDGTICDDDGNPLHFDSREDAEDYVDTMLLN